MKHHILLANVDSMEKLLQGSGGFVLGVVFSVFVFVKFILPRWDKLIATTERLADAIQQVSLQAKDIIEQQKTERHESFQEILERLPKHK